MLLMTLLQLKYIVKIVECGSMNEASHELYDVFQLQQCHKQHL